MSKLVLFHAETSKNFSTSIKFDSFEFNFDEIKKLLASISTYRLPPEDKKNIESSVITDEVIKEAINALFTVHSLDTNNFLFSIAAWVKSVPSDVSAKNKELADLVAQVVKLEKEVTTADNEMDKVAINCEKLQKVQNPKNSVVPPVDDKASSMVKNSLSKISIHTKEFANKTIEMFKALLKVNQ